MSNPNHRPADCDLLLELEWREADGLPLEPADAQRRADHLAGCEHCRREAALTDLLRYEPGEGPDAPLDDIARRRAVQAIVAAADRSAPALPLRAAEPARRTWSRSRLVALAVALVLILGGGITLLSLGSKDPTRSRGQAAPSLPPGKVLLSAGDVHLGEQSVDVGAPVRRGQTLRADRGRAAAELLPGVQVLVAPNSRVTVAERDHDRLRLDLDHGYLLTAVAPGRAGRVHITVHTAGGRVVVTGTIFSLTALGKRTLLQVHRGSVRVFDGSQPRRVEQGQATVFGDAHVRSLTAPESSRALGEQRLLRLLAGPTTAGAARMTIDSRPHGAHIALDGVPFGRAPLSANVVPGRRLAELALDGYSPTREWINARAGATLTHVVTLQRRTAVRDPDVEVPTIHVPAAPKVRAVSPETLLQRAQRARSARRWREAARGYRALIRQHPRSPQARVAIVSLGTIELYHRGNARAALRWFTRYLASGGGALAEEAAYGRIRALRRLGRCAAERDALRRFQVDHPQALRAAEVAARLRSLTCAK